MQHRLRLGAAFLTLLLTAVSAQAMAVVTAVPALNLRSGPGTGYAILRQLPAGTVVSVDGSSGAWRKVHVGSAVGWVSGAWLRDLSTSYTSCTSTAHIGDSLSAYVLPGLRTEYTARGVKSFKASAYGGRGVLQKVSGDPETGQAAATRIRGTGFAGCWVVALGTNDTANVAAGAWYSRATAIDRMMSAIDPYKKSRVMWVNTFTTRTTGYWSNYNMRLWNDALASAKSRWPNLRVFDWSVTASTGAATYADGIHHTSSGYTVRNRSIAAALAMYFPR